MDSTMVHEGLITRALQVAAQATPRFVAGQGLFNGADNEPVDEDAKAAAVVAIKILDGTLLKDQGVINRFHTQVHEVRTKGELRAVVEAVSALLPE